MVSERHSNYHYGERIGQKKDYLIDVIQFKVLHHQKQRTGDCIDYDFLIRVSALIGFVMFSTLCRFVSTSWRAACTKLRFSFVASAV